MQRAFSVWPLLLVLLGGAALAVCQWLIFFYAPVEAQLGLMQKVFYTHLPLAWWALISFLVVFVASIVYLLRRSPAADRVCAAAAEVGVLLAGLAPFLGRLVDVGSPPDHHAGHVVHLCGLSGAARPGHARYE